MFDAEKLLGGLLLGGGRRKTGLDSLIPGGAGMAILGVAMEAFEHFTNKSEAPAANPPPPLPPPTPGSAPMPEANTLPLPPPLPGTSPLSESPPPPPPSPNRDQGAILLIRAMIAAANADGTIQPEERLRILDRMRGPELSPEEQAFIENELQAPSGIEAIVGQVRTSEAARQVYAVSLMAIEVDTEAERVYLKALADRLGLDAATVNGIHRDMGAEPPP